MEKGKRKVCYIKWRLVHKLKSESTVCWFRFIICCKVCVITKTWHLRWVTNENNKNQPLAHSSLSAVCCFGFSPAYMFILFLLSFSFSHVRCQIITALQSTVQCGTVSIYCFIYVQRLYCLIAFVDKENEETKNLSQVHKNLPQTICIHKRTHVRTHTYTNWSHTHIHKHMTVQSI